MAPLADLAFQTPMATELQLNLANERQERKVGVQEKGDQSEFFFLFLFALNGIGGTGSHFLFDPCPLGGLLCFSNTVLFLS